MSVTRSIPEEGARYVYLVHSYGAKNNGTLSQHVVDVWLVIILHRLKGRRSQGKHAREKGGLGGVGCEGL